MLKRLKEWWNRPSATVIAIADMVSSQERELEVMNKIADILGFKRPTVGTMRHIYFEELLKYLEKKKKK